MTTLCEENQFSVDAVQIYCGLMFKFIPDAEKAQITDDQWRTAALLALLEFWAPAGTA